jgi:hypothetical protein
MMTCPSREIWTRLSLGEFAGEQAEALRNHAAGCATCDARRIAAEAQHQQLRDLHRAAVANVDTNRLWNSLAASAAAPATTESPRTGRSASPSIWRNVIMKHPRRALSAAVLLPAACVAIAVVLLADVGSTAAFARVQHRLGEIRTVVCRFRTGVTDLDRAESANFARLYFSKDRQRHDSYVDGRRIGQIYASNDGPTVHVTATATYLIHDAERADVADRLQWLDGLRTLPADAAISLGEETVDGRKALVFEVPIVGGRLWVDPATQLPLRYVVGPGAVFAEDGFAVYDEFQWDVTIDEDEFAAKPDGPTHDIKAPARGEEGLVEALRFFAERGDGTFPTSLACEDVVAELQKLTAYHGSVDPIDAYAARTGQANVYLGSACLFVRKLEQDGREPRYAGRGVKLGDATAVILTWQTDTRERRVIRGDLSIATEAE